MSLHRSETPPAHPPVHAVFFCVVSWFLPGAGFWLLGARKRAVLYTVLIHLTFAVGIVLDGGVVWPMSEPGLLGMAAIGILTFLMQMGVGWLGVLSLLAHHFGWSGIAAQAVSEYNELGTFYCLVAGTLNYFVACQAYDSTRKMAFEKLAGR